MKYKVGTIWGNCKILSNDRIGKKNFITMECGYCGEHFTRKVEFLSCNLKRTGRMSCGCMTKEWRASQKRDELPERIGKWKILKEIDTEKYQGRKCIAICPVCSSEGEYRVGNLNKTKMCQKCKGKIVRDRCRSKLKSENERLYGIWSGIKSRCNKPKQKSYKRLNLSYCDEWEDFEPFCKWALANGYSDELEIHRVNNDIGYYQNNCIWIDRESHRKIHIALRKQQGER